MTDTGEHSEAGSFRDGSGLEDLVPPSVLESDAFRRAKEELHRSFQEEQLADYRQKPLLVRAATSVGRVVGLARKPDYQALAERSVTQEDIVARMYEMQVEKMNATISDLQPQLGVYAAQVDDLSKERGELREELDQTRGRLIGQAKVVKAYQNALTELKAEVPDSPQDGAVARGYAARQIQETIDSAVDMRTELVNKHTRLERMLQFNENRMAEAKAYRASSETILTQILMYDSILQGAGVHLNGQGEQ